VVISNKGSWIAVQISRVVIFWKIQRQPYCCLGEFSGFEALHLFAFFPKLALHPDRTTTFLTDKQQSLWVDSVFLPALYGEYEGEDRLLQHFPGSYETAKANALSHGTEQSTYDHGLHLPRQQLIRHFIQPEKLSGLWDRCLKLLKATRNCWISKALSYLQQQRT
jgi:hypothetical protein